MSVIAISGASGFLGQHLGRELLARGHGLVALTRPQLYSKDLAAQLQGTETLMHLAARAHVMDAGEAAQSQYWPSNVGLTQTVARAARAAGVKRFVFLSSAGVLGACSPVEGFTEDTAPHPHDAYTASKLEAEEWLKSQFGANEALVIVRAPLIYGPGAKGNLARLMRLALKGWPLPIGALRAPRSLVGIRNIVDLLCTLASDARPIHATMLVADSETVSVAELFRIIAHHAGHRPWLAPAPPLLIRSVLSCVGRSHDIARLTCSFVLRPSIAQSLFNWTPPYSQQAEIRRTVLYALQAGADRNTLAR